MITLRQLRYFDAVAAAKSFARAAELHQVSQSALSQQIARLERSLGLSLFTRLPRGVALTPAGESLLPAAREVLRTMTRLVDSSSAQAAGHMQHLAVGSPMYAVRSPQRQRVMRAFHLAHPSTHIVFKNAWSPALIEAVLADELDATFSMSPPEQPGTQCQIVEDCAAVMVLRRDDPLAQLDRIGLTDLAGRVVVIQPPAVNRWMHEHLAAPLLSAGAQIASPAEPSLPAVLQQVVDDGVLAPAVPWEMDFVNADTLTDLLVRPTTGEVGLRFTLYLIRRAHPGPHVTDALWSVAATVLDEHASPGSD